MPDHSAAVAKSATNNGSAVDTVTLTTDFTQVEVLNRSTSATLWVRTDGTDPTVAGDDCYAVPPGTARRIESPGADAVRLLGSASCPFTVTGI